MLFEQGTCVILMQPETDLAAQAVARCKWAHHRQILMWITLSDGSGWVVTGHHPDILNFVFADEGDDDNHVPIGLLGRSLRAMDAEYLRVAHIKDKRRR